MTSHLLRSPHLLMLSILSIGLLVSPLRAQSQSDLRRDNQRLRTMTEDMTRELEALKVDLEAVKTENERLRRLLAAAARTVASAPPPSAAPVPAISIDETKPGSSPRALFAAIAASYEEETADLEIGGEDDDPKRHAYLRQIERWAARVNRKMKEPIAWHVEVLGPATRTARGFFLRLRALDPKTGTELGDPFDVFLTRAQASRLELHRERTDSDDLVLTGTLKPRIHVNEERMSEGAFSNPPLVGAFAEFAFRIDVQTLLPPNEKEDAKEQAKKDASGTAATAPAKEREGR